MINLKTHIQPDSSFLPYQCQEKTKRKPASKRGVSSRVRQEERKQIESSVHKSGPQYPHLVEKMGTIPQIVCHFIIESELDVGRTGLFGQYFGNIGNLLLGDEGVETVRKSIVRRPSDAIGTVLIGTPRAPTNQPAFGTSNIVSPTHDLESNASTSEVPSRFLILFQIHNFSPYSLKRIPI